MNIDTLRPEDLCVVLSHHLKLDLYSAQNLMTIIDNVIKICLEKRTGSADEADILRIRKIILNDLTSENTRLIPDYDLETCSIQTFVVVVTREIAVNYIRNAHYSASSVSSIFKAMSVDVSGAEDYLDGLEQLFSPSQKCVLRLRYGEGCDVSQIAGMLGVSVDEVRTVEWQAMQSLQHHWQSMRRSMSTNMYAAAGQA